MPSTSTQRPPKLCRHKATGRAYVTLNGREHYLGKHGSAASHEAYASLIAQWIHGGGHYRPKPQQEITVAEVMAAYIGFAKGYYRKNGKVTREYGLIIDACRAMKPLYGRALAVDFGPLALKTVRQTLVDSGISRDHINRQVGRIKRMFKWAAAEELISSDIPQSLSMVVGLRRGRTEAKEMPPVLPVDDANIESTLPHLPAVVADMVRFQRLTGCRPIEVCTLRPCDVDRSSDVWQYYPSSHKTEHHGRDRIIFVGPKAQEILIHYLARGDEMLCFRPCDSEQKRLIERESNRSTPLSCGNRRGTNRLRRPKRTAGEQYTSVTYARAVSRACDKAFPHPKLGYVMRSAFSKAEISELRAWQKKHRWSPNRLRHTAATEIRKEFGLEAAQVILGHSAADVTQVYAERDLSKGIQVAKRIG